MGSPICTWVRLIQEELILLHRLSAHVHLGKTNTIKFVLLHRLSAQVKMILIYALIHYSACPGGSGFRNALTICILKKEHVTDFVHFFILYQFNNK